jgi:hypothetical protein
MSWFSAPLASSEESRTMINKKNQHSTSFTTSQWVSIYQCWGSRTGSDPQDLHLFRLPGSGSISQRYG